MSLIRDFAEAVAKQEGFYTSGSAAQRNNNPGNLMDYSYYQQTGQFRLATYPTVEDGWNALEAQIQRDANRGLTLEEFTAKYAPAGHGDNNPEIYAANLSSWLPGLSIGTKLSDWLSGNIVIDDSTDTYTLGEDGSTSTLLSVGIGIIAIVLLLRFVR